MAQLTIIPTPIGNLKDITLRSLEQLQAADLILAEDTRTSRVLLKHYDIHVPLESHHKFNEFQTANQVAERITGGLNVALISDAGTPGISDPGAILVQACIKAGVKVECLPGATALIPALVTSGMDTTSFCFEGFLPVKKGRQTKLKELANERRTIIIYESPYRVLRTLNDLSEHFGADHPVATCRELSKLHETVNRGTVQELIELFTNHPPKGEFVMLIAGKNQIEKDRKKEKKEKLNQ